MISVQDGHSIRIYPDRIAWPLCAQWCGASRWLYNQRVGEHRTAVEPYELNQGYSRFKTGADAWVKDVPPEIFRNAAQRHYRAYRSMEKGNGGVPVFKKKHVNNDSCWITSENFLLERIPAPTGNGNPATTKFCYKLSLMRNGNRLAEIKIKSHREFNPADVASITITRSAANAWHLTFSTTGFDFDEEAALRELMLLPKEDLDDMVSGYDRGVVIEVADSDGVHYRAEPSLVDNSAARSNKIRQKQRQLSRRHKGSVRYEKLRKEIAALYEINANGRKDTCHKISRKMVDKNGVCVHGFENLKLKNMTRKPKAKQAADGTWLRNGARAKAGLNKAILNVALGTIKTMATYKAAKKRSLTISVPAYHSSNECCKCGYTHPDNRKTQADFQCLSCLFTANADDNAALVVKKRTIAMILSGEALKQLLAKNKKKKTISCTKKKRCLSVGVVDVSKPVESVSAVGGTSSRAGVVRIYVQGESVRRAEGSAPMYADSENCETHTTQLIVSGG